MSIDWHALFGLGDAPLELVVRGTAMYWFLFFLFRLVVRRRIGAVGMADFLVIAIVADAAQNGMAGTYTSITDGMILVATLIAWNHVIDWATFRSRWLEQLLEPPPLLLVRDGRILHRNLRAEYVTLQELRAKLREQGVSDVADVKEAYIEPDGEFSVITRPERDASSR